MSESLVNITGTDVTIDETAGLQNSGSTPPGDADDDDVLFSTIPELFSLRLTALGATDPALGAAESDGDVVTFSPTGELGNVALTDADGALLDGDDSGLKTTDGESILLYTDTDNDNIVLGKTAGGTLVFAIYLEETGGTATTGPTGGKLWTVQYEAIYHDGGDTNLDGDGNNHDSAVDLTGLVHVTAFEAQTFSFENAPSGSNLFMAFGDASQALVITGENPADESSGENVSSGSTVNSSQGGGTTTLGIDGQQIKAQQAIVVTFVTGAEADYLAGPAAGNDPGQPLSPTEALDEANIQFSGYVLAQAAQFTISQMTPGNTNTTTSLEINAYLTADGSGDHYIDGNPLVQGDSAVNITTDSVEVLRGDVNVVGTLGVTVNYTEDGVVVMGVKNGDVVRYETDADHNRVLIRNDQPEKGSGSNVAFDLGGFTLTEVAGDTDEIGSKIFFEDDGPAIALTSLAPTIAVDESLGTAGSSKDEPGNAAPDDETNANAPAGAIGYAVTTAATLFTETADAGTDGEASKVYALVLNAGASGLTDTASGQAVVLSDNSGVIEGRTDDANADLVFSIAVDATTGDVTTTQYRALDHGADSNDHDSAVSMAAGLVELEATLTDGDTDTASSKIELGSLIGFEDDGPAIALTSLAPTIAVDESLGTAGSSKDEPGNAAPDDETNANAPAGAIGYAVTTAATLFTETADAGTDGEASKVYALVLNAGASGLTDTASGQAVVLSDNSGVIEGRTDDANADLVFSIAVDATTGDVTTTQYRALDHGADSNDHDSAVSMAAGLVELEATLTDGDTDTASSKIELGSLIGFEDDGPAIALTSLAPTIAVDESLGTAGSSKDEPGNAAPDDETTTGAPAEAIGYAETAASVLFSETADAGTDGEASKVYALVLNAGASGLTDTASGQAVVLSDNSGVIEGRTDDANADLVFSIAVNGTTGDVTTTQYRALDHGDDGNDHDIAVSMTSGLVELEATLTDGDTDTASSKIELGSLIGFEDDGPAIALTSLAPTIAVDESLGTAGSSKDEPGNAAPDDETNANAPAGAIGYAETAASVLFSEVADAGTDGEASKVYALVLNAGASGLTDTASGQAVVLSDNSGVIEGRTDDANADLVFSIAVDATTGDVTTTQYRALDHGADSNDHDSAVSMAVGLVELEATLTDGDTDTASSKIELGSLIGFEDDGPAIALTSLAPTIAVDESLGTAGSSKDEPGNAAPDDETTTGAPAEAIGYAETAASVLFSETADAGTDGEASKVYALVLNAGASGLTDTASGQAVVLSDNSGVIEGRTDDANADLVFSIAVDATTGDVTTTQYRALDHGADSNDHDSAVSMAAGLVELEATLTDGDTDTASSKIELGSLIGFEDDGPAIALTSLAPTIAVDESLGTAGSVKDEPGDAANNDETTTGAPAEAIGYAVTTAATLFSETADAGTDGEASKVYALVLNAGASGLTDTASGQAVVLSDNSGVIEGRTDDANADLVFSIAVDATTGDVTTTQYRALDHGADSNDHDSAVSMAAGLVELEATLTDGDTDTASSKIELGSLIGFEDDGPAIALTSLAPTIAVDESLGTAGSSKDEPGNAAPDDETNANAPAGAIGYAVTTAATLFTETADAGTDGEASKVYALVLNAGASGLTDTASGQAVVLSDNSGVIEGRTDDANADLVFSIAVDATTGDVTTTQYRALDHGADSNDHDSAVSMAAGLVELEATLTDGDTDTASSKIELGSLIGFEDDGPAIAVSNASGTYATPAEATGDFVDGSGTDGFGDLAITFNWYQIDGEGLIQTSGNPNVTFVESVTDTTWAGTIFDDFNGDGVSETVAFTLDVDLDTNEYTVTLDTPPAQETTTSTADGSLDAGGPDAVRTLLFGGDDAGSDDIVFFGAVATAPRSDVLGGNPYPAVPNDIEDLVVEGEPDLTEAQIEGFLTPTNQIPTLINASTQMNVSTSGIGINNNNLDGDGNDGGSGAFFGTSITSGDESFVVNPEPLVDSVTVYISSTVQGYDPETEDLYYTVYYADGTIDSPQKVTEDDLTRYANNDVNVPKEAKGGSSFTIEDEDGDRQIDAVQLTMGLGTIKIPVIEFNTLTQFDPESLELNFTATLEDGDEDTATDDFTVDFSPEPPAELSYVSLDDPDVLL